MVDRLLRGALLEAAELAEPDERHRRVAGPTRLAQLGDSRSPLHDQPEQRFLAGAVGAREPQSDRERIRLAGLVQLAGVEPSERECHRSQDVLRRDPREGRLLLVRDEHQPLLLGFHARIHVRDARLRAQPPLDAAAPSRSCS